LGNGLIYVVGGYNAFYEEAYATTDILDPASGWSYGADGTTIAPMLEGRGDFAVVHDKDTNLIYAFAGFTTANGFCSPLSSAEVYDPTTDAWTAIDPLLLGRGDKASGILNGRIFAVGGEAKEDPEDCESAAVAVMDVEVFDTADGDDATWMVAANIPEEKFRFAAASYESTLYVFGGQKQEKYCASKGANCNKVTNHVWAFSEEKKGGGGDGGDNINSASVTYIALGILGLILLLAGVAIATSKTYGWKSNKPHRPLSGEVSNALHVEDSTL